MWNSHKRLFNKNHVNIITRVVYKSHYEALNVTKNATHKEIKNAYYRLSMIYHPDKNKGSEEAANKFRDINSAYEILGNVRQRKLYDSGSLGTIPNRKNSHYNSKQPFDTMNTKSDLHKTSTTNRDYNFDEWSKVHYTKAFNEHYNNRKILSQRKLNEEYATQQNSYTLLTVIVGTSALILITMFDYIKTVTYKHKSINQIDRKKF